MHFLKNRFYPFFKIMGLFPSFFLGLLLTLVSNYQFRFSVPTEFVFSTVIFLGAISSMLRLGFSMKLSCGQSPFALLNNALYSLGNAVAFNKYLLATVLQNENDFLSRFIHCCAEMWTETDFQFNTFLKTCYSQIVLIFKIQNFKISYEK